MKLDFNNGFILGEPDSPEENQTIMECLNSSGLFALPDKVKYKNGTWIIAPSIVEKLNIALIPLKGHILLSDAFKNFISNYRQSKKTPATQNPVAPDGEIVLNVGVVKTKIIRNGVSLPEDDLQKAMRFFSKAAFNSKAFKDKRWDGYIHLYDKRSKTFPTGLLGDAERVFEKHKIKYSVNIIYDETPKREYNWVANDGITPDKDQIDAIEAALKGRRGIIKAPTGFGKTAVLAKRLIARRGVKTLFVANKKLLLEDAKKEFLDGIDGLTKVDVIADGVYGDTKLKKDLIPSQLDAPVVVATIQSLSARLQDPKTAVLMKEWLNNEVKFIMVDECQAVGTKMWDEVLNEVNAPYRIMLSATPRRTDGATLKIKAASGPALFMTDAETQIKKNRLCELDIQFVKYDHKLYNEDDANLEYQDIYKQCIVYNDERNTLLCNLADSLVKEDRNVLMLIVSIDHGHLLYEKLLTMGYTPDDIRIVWGDTSQKVRQKAIDDFRSGKYKILIGSTIFDAGANIPSISGLILAGAGRADITLIQRIGRAARNCDYEKTIGRIPKFMQGIDKKCSKVYDILDMNVKFFRMQSKVRFYNAREEFGKERVSVLDGTARDFYRPKKGKGESLDPKNMTFAVSGTDGAVSLEDLKNIFGE